MIRMIFILSSTCDSRSLTIQGSLAGHLKASKSAAGRLSRPPLPIVDSAAEPRLMCSFPASPLGPPPTSKKPGHPVRAKFPMTMDSPRPRKRRAINACVSCRTSKVRCDGNRPCQRCDRNGASCQYFDAVKDENVLRIERLENEMAALREHMRIQRHQDKSVRRPEDYTRMKEANRNIWRQCRLQGVLFAPCFRW